jgi:hypothetical protein
MRIEIQKIMQEAGKEDYLEESDDEAKNSIISS